MLVRQCPLVVNPVPKGTIHVAKTARRRCLHRALPVTAAAAEGPFSKGVIDALKRYGDHAKAAYILFDKVLSKDGQEAIQKGQSMVAAVSDRVNSAEVEHLANFTGVANMLGFPGDVFTVPDPVDNALLDVAAGEAPSFIGCVSETTGADGVKEIVFAFRGSVINSDWVSNLVGGVAAEDLYGAGNGRAHTGFYNLIHTHPDDVAQAVTPMKVITDVLRPYKAAYDANPATYQLPRVITTGHSLGGGLAVLAAVLIQKYIPAYQADHADYTKRLLQTYTYAAPRVGDADFSKYMRDTLHYSVVQVKNKTDATPFTPPEGFTAVPGFLVKLFGMWPRPPKDSGAAGEPDNLLDIQSAVLDQPVDTLEDDERWEAYQQLLQQCDSIEALEQRLAEMEALEEEEEEALIETAAVRNLRAKIGYCKDLILTLTTGWADTPAPSFGACFLNVKDYGRWGGQNHSLEVYLKNLDACSKS